MIDLEADGFKTFLFAYKSDGSNLHSPLDDEVAGQLLVMLKRGGYLEDVASPVVESLREERCYCLLFNIMSWVI